MSNPQSLMRMVIAGILLATTSAVSAQQVSQPKTIEEALDMSRMGESANSIPQSAESSPAEMQGAQKSQAEQSQTEQSRTKQTQTESASIDPPTAEEGDIWQEFAVRDDEAGAAARAVLPLKKEQVEEFAKLYLQIRDQAAAGKGPAPRARAKNHTVSFDTASIIPSIEVHKGYVSALVFLDVTGAPWPVKEVLVNRVFLPGDDSDSEQKGPTNKVYLAPQKANLHGNLTVELEGLNIPIQVRLKDGKGKADYRMDILVPKPGPNADQLALLQPKSFMPGDPRLLGFRTGFIPEGAITLAVTGGDSYRDRAWRMDGPDGGVLYLKTDKALLAPAPEGFDRGPDGFTVYALPDTPYVVVSNNGVRQRLAFRLSQQGAGS